MVKRTMVPRMMKLKNHYFYTMLQIEVSPGIKVIIFLFFSFFLLEKNYFILDVKSPHIKR